MNYNKIYIYILIVLLGLLIGTNLQAMTTASVQTDEAVVTNPDAQNLTEIPNSGENEYFDNIKKHGKSGFVIMITAMGIVFLGLIVLYLFIILVGSAAINLSIQRAMKVFGATEEEAKGITKQSGEIYAAIAMAIYEATELHDEENTILTQTNTVRNYSPWSSKIYTLREIPKR
jgi:Na+-transporting methylmalonyl-CoA/oxaloacetate decarboxylase gamma subunit